MTMRVQHVGRAVGSQPASGQSTAGLAEHASAVVLAATRAARRQGAPSAAPSRPMSADAAAVTAAAIGALADPNALLLAMQARLRNVQANTSEREVKDASIRADQASRARMKAIHEAEKAAEKASKFLGIFGGKLGKVLGEVVKAVTVVAGLLAAGMTGGLAAPLLVAGMVLMLGAQKIAHEAVKLGIIDKKDEGTLALGLEIAGAALSAAGSVASVLQAGSSAASAASEGAKVAQDGAKAGMTAADTLQNACGAVSGCVDGVGEIAQGAHQIVHAIFQHDHDIDMADAAQHAVEGHEATQRIDDGVDDYREVFARYGRVAHRLHEAAQAQHRARQAATQTLA